jgi:hypothetical protein
MQNWTTAYERREYVVGLPTGGDANKVQAMKSQALLYPGQYTCNWALGLKLEVDCIVVHVESNVSETRTVDEKAQ